MFVNEMSNLRTTTPGTDLICLLLGYHSVNDGGGGTFYWDGNSTEIDDAGTIIQVAGILTGRWKRIYDKVVNVKWFGANGTLLNDDPAFISAISTGEIIVVPEINTDYKIRRLLIQEGKSIRGEGSNVQISCDSNIAPNVNFASNTKIENLKIYSLQENLDWNRSGLDSVENVTILDCSFEGFRAATFNAWGILIQQSKRIRIQNCYFDNNAQSDIALTEGCEDVMIINASGSALHLNLEPNNGSLPIKNIAVIGGNYDIIELNESSLTSICIQNFKASALSINNLRYAGATAQFESCKIENVIPEFTYIYAGSVEFGGSIQFGPNLIKDPCVSKLNATEGTEAEWSPEYISSGQSISRLASIDKGSWFIRLNDKQEPVVASIKHIAVDIEESKKYALILTSSANYPMDAGYIGHNTLLSWTIDTGGVISHVEQYVYSNRGEAGTATNIVTQTAILHPPAKAKSLRVILTNSSLSGLSTSSVDIYKVGLYEIVPSVHIDNNHYTSNSLLNRGDEQYYTSGAPAIFPGGTDNLYLPGMVLNNRNLNDATSEGWICVENGNPGEWRPIGLLGV